MTSRLGVIYRHAKNRETTSGFTDLVTLPDLG